jgi:hypothetical protein
MSQTARFLVGFGVYVLEILGVGVSLIHALIISKKVW